MNQSDAFKFIVEKSTTIETEETWLTGTGDVGIGSSSPCYMINKQNPTQKTTFINIRMNTRDLNEGILFQ